MAYTCPSICFINVKLLDTLPSCGVISHIPRVYRHYGAEELKCVHRERDELRLFHCFSSFRCSSSLRSLLSFRLSHPHTHATSAAYPHKQTARPILPITSSMSPSFRALRLSAVSTQRKSAPYPSTPPTSNTSPMICSVVILFPCLFSQRLDFSAVLHIIKVKVAFTVSIVAVGS